MNPLWQFMLHTYAQEGMKEHCLRLQNEQGQDVLLYLWQLWLKETGQTKPQAQALASYLHWRDTVIVPLRQVRMSVRKDQEPLRAQLLQAELSAEQVGAQLLYQLSS